MKIIFLLNGFVFLGIFIFFLVHFIKNRDKKMEKISRLLTFMGILYFLFSISSFLWFLDILKYVESDFLILYSILLIFQSLILFGVVYLFSRNKRLYLFLIFYFITLFSFLIVSHDFFTLSIFTSFLFMLLIFFEFIFPQGESKKIGYFGIGYSLVSVILNLFLIYDIGNIYLFSFFSNLLFFVFIFLFLKKSKDFSLEETLKFKKEKSYFISLISHLIFVITITNFIFIGTIAVHEFGHYGASKFYDCDYRKIVYEGDLFHTEILCGEIDTTSWVTMGGILAPLVLALILFLIGGKFMKEVAFLITGFDLISVSRDFSSLGISDNFIVFVVVLGFISLVYGLFILIKSRTEDDLYLDELLETKNLIKIKNVQKKDILGGKKELFN